MLIAPFKLYCAVDRNMTKAFEKHTMVRHAGHGRFIIVFLLVPLLALGSAVSPRTLLLATDMGERTPARHTTRKQAPLFLPADPSCPTRTMAIEPRSRSWLIPGGVSDAAPHGFTSIGATAVHEYNRVHGTALEMQSIQSAQQQFASGMKYRLCIRTSSKDIMAIIYDPLQGDRRFEFLEQDPTWMCPPPRPFSPPPSFLELQSTTEASLSGIDDTRFHLATAFPACSSIMNKRFIQGHCASCSAIAVLTAVRDMHCISSTDAVLHQQLLDLHLDVAKAMTIASRTDSQIPKQGIGCTPYRSFICEGAFVADYLDHVRDHGVDLVARDTYTSVLATAFLESHAYGRMRTQEELTSLTLECTSPTVSVSTTTPIQQERVLLTGYHSHLSYCKQKHQRRMYPSVDFDPLAGISGDMQRAPPVPSVRNLALDGYRSVPITVPAIKEALLKGPLVVTLLLYHSFIQSRRFYRVPDPTSSQTRLFNFAQSQQLSEHEKTQCQQDPHCDYVISLHALVLVGWNERLWVLRHHHESRTSALFVFQEQTTLLFKYIDQPFLNPHHQVPAPTRFPAWPSSIAYSIDGQRVDSLGALSHIRIWTRHDDQYRITNTNGGYDAVLALRSYEDESVVEIVVEPHTSVDVRASLRLDAVHFIQRRRSTLRVVDI